MRPVYYNEFDKEKAAWIRELMKAGVIAAGDVDERSICDVQPGDIRGYTQCHFFAGIGVWSYALRLAGWRDDEPVWTGSCPCPSFSCAGKGAGFDDPRHLWPAWERLIRECRPAVVFGEQADDAIGFGWLDLVQAQMEALAYAVGKAVLASASVGGSDIRQRLYWVADREGERRDGRTDEGNGWRGELALGLEGEADRVADRARGEPGRVGEEQTGPASTAGASGGLADADGLRRDGGCEGTATQEGLQSRSEHSWELARGTEGLGGDGAKHPMSDALKGFWRDADWLLCTDGRWRPVEPGTFPLAHGAPARLGRLRGFGDAINAEVARTFIESYREARGEC